MITDKKNNSELLTSLLFALLCAVSVFFLLYRPVPRQIGLTFRNTLYIFPLIFITALLSNMVRHRYVHALLLSILFSFVLLPYSGMINSGASDQYALGGVVPWSDAFTMQLNSQRFLYGGMMEQSTAIRPLSLIFYSLFLRIFGRNFFALQIFLCIMTALCLICAMKAISSSFGSICGAMFFSILYFYIRQRIGTFMTEPFGILCGLLCCTLLLRGFQTGRQRYFLIGFLFLSIGLNARPAAMFLFPAMGLWYFFIFLKNTPKRIYWAGTALIMMLSGFIFNRAAQIKVYGNEPIPNRQAAEMVYGLCLGGKSWGDVVSTPEMTSLKDSENIIKDVADLCIPIIKEHPENILSALKTIFIDSLIRSEYYGAFSYVRGNPRALETAVRYTLMFLWLAGFCILIIKRKEPRYSFLLAGALGITLSECAAVPFSTNYLRLYAVSIWIPACITGVFLQTVYSKFRGTTTNQTFAAVPGNALWIIIPGSLILFSSVFGAGLIRSYPLDSPESTPDLCAAGQKILITSIDPGSYIYLDEKENLAAEHIPYFRLPYVRQHIHDTASVEMFPFTDAIDSPTAIIRGIDLNTLADALIFAPLDMVRDKTGYAQFCGIFIDPPILRNDRFFIPSSVTFIEDN